jgi:hypothetical protein
MEITVAGTVQVSHLIPSLPPWITGKSPNRVQIYELFPELMFGFQKKLYLCTRNVIRDTALKGSLSRD